MIPPPPRSTLFPYTTLFRSFEQLGVQLEDSLVSQHASEDLVAPFFLGVQADDQDFPGQFFRSEEHTSELQSHSDLVCRLLLEKKKNIKLVRLQTLNK